MNQGLAITVAICITDAELSPFAVFIGASSDSRLNQGNSLAFPEIAPDIHPVRSCFALPPIKKNPVFQQKSYAAAGMFSRRKKGERFIRKITLMVSGIEFQRTVEQMRKIAEIIGLPVKETCMLKFCQRLFHFQFH